jgi:hypothetical protein
MEIRDMTTDRMINFQEENTRPNQLVIQVTGPLGTGTYRCEITTETPSFVTLERRKNITVVGNDKINNKVEFPNPV